MSDATTTDPAEAEMSDELKELVKTTKRGFDPSARLRSRGLRTATIRLYLDEEKGPKLGWAHDIRDGFNNVVGRERVGVVGALESAEAKLEGWLTRGRLEVEVAKSMTKAAMDKHHKGLVKAVEDLTAERDKLKAEMDASALIIKMRAVPPVIQKDTRRKAKAKLKITGKTIPEELEDEFAESQAAFLMMVMFESVTDTETGGVNTETTYEDGVEYVRYLPPGQFDRLDAKMAETQFTDAISREIEGQEDFS